MVIKYEIIKLIEWKLNKNTMFKNRQDSRAQRTWDDQGNLKTNNKRLFKLKPIIIKCKFTKCSNSKT